MSEMVKKNAEDNRPLLALARIVAEAYQGERNAFDKLTDVYGEGEESIEPQTDSGSDLEDMIVWSLAGVYEPGLNRDQLIQRAIKDFSETREILDNIVLALNAALGNQK